MRIEKNIYKLEVGGQEVFENTTIYLNSERSEHFLKQGTGKSLSEALTLASTNPQYDNRLFIELRVQYIKIASSGGSGPAGSSSLRTQPQQT